MSITKKEFKRFEKQIILKNVGLAGQKKISTAKVLVIGLGGLGSPLLLYLANSGLKNIGIIDHDKVELSNLNRQILFNDKDIGKYKVNQAKKVLTKINKEIKLSVFKSKLTKNNINQIISKFDIVCDGTDNFKTRYFVNDYCLRNKKILITAAINKLDGQLFKFDFKKKLPCFRCFMPEIPDNKNNCDTDGILPSVAGIMGSLLANEILKTILKSRNDLSGKMIIFNADKLEFRKVKISINPNCVNKC